MSVAAVKLLMYDALRECSLEPELFDEPAAFAATISEYGTLEPVLSLGRDAPKPGRARKPSPVPPTLIFLACVFLKRELRNHDEVNASSIRRSDTGWLAPSRLRTKWPANSLSFSVTRV